MKKLILTAMLAVLLAPLAFADIALETETKIQSLKLYNAEAFGGKFEVEQEAQTYLFGVKITLDDLSLTPKIGVLASSLEVAEEVELDNDLGLACGLDAEYGLLKTKNNAIILDLIGSYLYTSCEIDEAKILSSGMSLDNPLRNELTTNSFEVGLKVSTGLLSMITPYLAVVYSDSTMELATDNLPIHLNIEAEAEENIGLRLGAEGSLFKGLNVKAQASLIDKKEFAVSCSYLF